MRKQTRFIHNTALLTASTLALRFIGCAFQVWLANRIGSAGIGLYQLMGSVSGLAITLDLSGIGFGSTRLISEQLGKQRSVQTAVSHCILYALFFGILSGVLLFFLAEPIGFLWIEDGRTVLPLEIMAVQLPFIALSAVFTGYFTACGRVGRSTITQLLQQTHEILRTQGYSGVVLVPEEGALFDYYQKFGYRAVTTVAEFSCDAGDTSLPLRQIDATEYAHLRDRLLPMDGVIHSGVILDFLVGYCKLYAGDDFLLAAEFIDGHLIAQELLGNVDAAPGIVKSLDCVRGHFRTPGNDRNFAMFLPLTANCPIPTYFGLALD